MKAAALRVLLKGGFLFVDDFKPPGWRSIPGGGWEPFAESMRRGAAAGSRVLDMRPSVVFTRS